MKVDVSRTHPKWVQEGRYLWQGDITRLAADAIVNVANPGLTELNHTCIDNCIHFRGRQKK